ncbi:MAG TPA: hypothetical protein VLS51_06250 [Propionibacteriaceae bacterium]|nr:hypothetical protein [Propionibacteriaceae bacterium]
MTLETLVGAALRRWYVLLVGILLTLGTCAYVMRLPGVYWASAKVYFLPPSTVPQPNQLAPDSSVAIPFAGLIQTQINDGVPRRLATSPDVRLVDQGIYDGWSVMLPNTGGQWANNFSEPALIVQATGPTPQAVTTRMAQLLARITQLVRQDEDSAGVQPQLRVSLNMSPTTVDVQYSNGHRSRAVGEIVLLGVLVSLTACRVVDRVVATRRRRGESGRRGEPTDDGIGDARVRDAAGGHQDGAGGQGAEPPPGPATDRGGDGSAP